MPSVTGPFSSLLLTVVFALMWRSYRERWLGLWALASALWTLRYLASTVLGTLDIPHRDEIVHAIALGRNIFLLLGGYALVGRPLPRLWYGLLAFDALLLVWEFWYGSATLWGARGGPHYLLYGVSTLATAWILFAQRRVLGAETVLVAVCFTIVAVTVGAFPWLRTIPGLDPALFSIVHASQLGVGFGALLLFHRRAIAERDAALERLEAALSKAIAGYLPICAHCKSIQNERGEWEILERYFTTRTATAFSHGICPSCEQKHYGDLDALVAGPSVR